LAHLLAEGKACEQGLHPLLEGKIIGERAAEAGPAVGHRMDF